MKELSSNRVKNDKNEYDEIELDTWNRINYAKAVAAYTLRCQNSVNELFSIIDD